MAIPFREILRGLPQAEQDAIAARSAELVAEYLSLAELRRDRAISQTSMAERLGIKQENVSRMERRDDLLVSTLSSYVAAMGGELRLVAEFPDRDPVVLSGLGAGTPLNLKPRDS